LVSFCTAIRYQSMRGKHIWEKRAVYRSRRSGEHSEKNFRGRTIIRVRAKYQSPLFFRSNEPVYHPSAGAPNLPGRRWIAACTRSQSPLLIDYVSRHFLDPRISERSATDLRQRPASGTSIAVDNRRPSCDQKLRVNPGNHRRTISSAQDPRKQRCDLRGQPHWVYSNRSPGLPDANLAALLSEQ